MSTPTFELSPELRKHSDALREWSAAEVRPYARAADTTKLAPDNWREIFDTAPVPIGRIDIEGDALPVFPDGYWVGQIAFYENLNYGDV